MLSYCLNCRTNTEIKNSKVVRTNSECFYQNVKCAVVENRNLLKNKKPVEY